MNTIHQLLQDILHKPNAISVSAYDTAWLAWLMPEARDWLLDAQRPDGSWGADLEYHHDRVICTLSAINALAAASTNGHDLQRIQRGIQYLEKAAFRLSRDPTETVGFELLVPSLLKTGQNLGLKLNNVARALEPYEIIYRQKMALVPPAMLYSPQATMAHSLEFVGLDNLDHAAIAGLRLANGSIHSSPAATAFCEIAGAGHRASQDYLSSTLEYYQGAAPTLAPFELFEIIWSLLHLHLGEDLTQCRETCQSLIKRIEACWGPEGIGLTEGFPADFDNTAAAFTLLSKLSRAPDVAVLKAFEEDDHFRCYRFERNISLDVHIHLTMTLRQSPDFAGRDEMLLKAINVLSRYLQADFITDKWHVSPYYSTAHAVIALSGLADHLIEDQIYWLCHTQQEDGRWTFYPAFPPAAVEETAHALLALLTVQKNSCPVAPDTIERGMDYLRANYQDHQSLPALWVGKSLYHPLHITRSVFLAVFALYDQLN
jgi:halimadienyl-diphosphate synthase